MLASVHPSRSPAAGSDKVVVLILSDGQGGFDDLEKLRATLASGATPVRVLLCCPERFDLSLATMLAELEVEVQILLGPDVNVSATTTSALHAPPSTSVDDLTEFALALSDVVLVASKAKKSRLTSAADDLRKPMIAPGDALSPITSVASIARRLDPERPGWHPRGRWFFGRFEQSMLELLAFAWLGWTKRGVAESLKRLRKCQVRGWRPTPYFAPEGWQKLAPDFAAIDGSSKIVVGFDTLDRSALYGSYIHRDLAWIAHLGAAFAVLAAVAGHLGGNETWGIVELVTLAAVALLVFGARRFGLQDRWTACRLAAEQLRIARMSLPLLVLPPALATADKPPQAEGSSSKETELGFEALAEAKRIVRNQGLPRTDPGFAPAEAAAWLQLIVADQVGYHDRNHHKLECAENRLRRATQALFIIAMIAVLAHLYLHAPWLLLLTAAGPAFAAALHGAGTRLGIVHRIALSRDVERELKQIDKSLAELSRTPPPLQQAWREVRQLAYRAAETMGRENTSWHGLVRRYRDDLPS